jgi:signal transduction histidine kinase
VGWKEGATGATRVSSRNESQAGYTLMVNEPVTVFDLMSETRFTGSPLLHEHGVVSGMSVPISGKERPFGVLGVHTKHRRIFTLDDTNFLLSVANVLASAIERQHNELSQRLLAEIRDITGRKQIQADLVEVQRRLIDSVEAERLRLSQELHDGPIQDLYGITYQLSDLASTDFSEADHMEKFHSNIESTTQMVKQVVELLRSICGDLRPPSLAPFGLEKAIRAHTDEIGEKYPNLSIRLDLMPDGQTVPERVRLALFRICQHAVSNVIRHSGAKNLTVQFSYDPEQVLLGIEDDGCGFELPTSWIELARSGHLGLAGTAERVEAIGGQLQIISAPGKGTVIQITAPLKQEASEHFVQEAKPGGELMI